MSKVPLFLKQSQVQFNHVCVVSGSTNSLKYANIVLNSMEASSYLLHNNTEETVNQLKEFCIAKGIDLLIGVGGGSVLDVVKRVSLLADIANLMVPTIISNDGIVSPISVIKDSSNHSISLPAKMPFGVVVDLDVIQAAPTKFLQAAAGDILSNISATNDWVLASSNKGERINDLAYMLSRSAAFALIHHESKDIKNKSFLKQVIYCQLSSGLAMDLAGTSRPCSGSEHLLSHAIDFLRLSENTLHGLQVGSISIFCLYLQKKLDAKCLNYALELDLPLAFHQLDPKIYDRLAMIFDVSFEMRPGRFTVLDMYRGKSFPLVYQEYLDFLERFKIFNNPLGELKVS